MAGGGSGRSLRSLPPHTILWFCSGSAATGMVPNPPSAQQGQSSMQPLPLWFRREWSFPLAKAVLSPRAAQGHNADAQHQVTSAEPSATSIKADLWNAFIKIVAAVTHGRLHRWRNPTQKNLCEKAKESNSDLGKQDQHLWQQKDPEGAELAGLGSPSSVAQKPVKLWATESSTGKTGLEEMSAVLWQARMWKQATAQSLSPLWKHKTAFPGHLLGRPEVQVFPTREQSPVPSLPNHACSGGINSTFFFQEKKGAKVSI